MTCELAPCTHMIDKMHKRGISYKEVKETILKGQKSHRNDCCSISKHSLFCVIYRKKPCHYFGITTHYLER